MRRKPKKDKRRETFRKSNRAAIDWLQDRGFRDIILRTHCRHHDMWYKTPGVIDECMDYWNHWDGMGWDNIGNLWFFQIKTTGFPSDKFILNWMQKRRNIRAIAIEVTPKTRARYYYKL